MLRVRVTQELIEKFLTTGAESPSIRISQGIPVGAELVDVVWNPRLFTAELHFEHPDYPGAEPVDLLVHVTVISPLPPATEESTTEGTP